MPDVTILHNPRCSNSRRALEACSIAGVELEVVRYLDEQAEACGAVPDDRTIVVERFRDEQDVACFVDLFHAHHERVFAVSEPGQRVELVHCSGRLTASPAKPERTAWDPVEDRNGAVTRSAWFPGHGSLDTLLFAGPGLTAGDRVTGPALIVESTTTLVVPPGCELVVTAAGDFLMELS
mgnify:CR=1 FL=1